MTSERTEILGHGVKPDGIIIQVRKTITEDSMQQIKVIPLPGSLELMVGIERVPLTYAQALHLAEVLRQATTEARHAA